MIRLENLDAHLLEDLQTSNHPSEFLQDREKEYNLLIMRLPEVVDQEVKITSLAFVIYHDQSYIYQRETKTLQQLGGIAEVNEYLDTKIEILIKEIQHYHIHIDELEDSLYDGSTNNTFMQKWLVYKKEISLINRLMFHASIAFELFTRKYNQESLELSMADVLEHIRRVKDLSFAAMEKLDNLYDFYRAKVDEKMNKNMYYLTILSAVFLPLTLISGFFGMNTGGLPFVEDSDGTLKATLLALALELLFIIPFVLKRFEKMTRFKRRKKD